MGYRDPSRNSRHDLPGIRTLETRINEQLVARRDRIVYAVETNVATGEFKKRFFSFTPPRSRRQVPREKNMSFVCGSVVPVFYRRVVREDRKTTSSFIRQKRKGHFFLQQT